MQELKGLKKMLEETNARCFHTFFDKSIGYRVTIFLGHSDGCQGASVLWLPVRKLPSIPSWIPVRKLRCLEIEHGRLKTLWENQVF